LGYNEGDAKIFLLKNDPGAFYRAPKFDFLEIFFGNFIETKRIDPQV
jgi:hypothetical protein